MGGVCRGRFDAVSLGALAHPAAAASRSPHFVIAEQSLTCIHLILLRKLTQSLTLPFLSVAVVGRHGEAAAHAPGAAAMPPQPPRLTSCKMGAPLAYQMWYVI